MTKRPSKFNKARTLRATIGITASGGRDLQVVTPDPVLLDGMPLPAEATYSFANATFAQPWAGHRPIKIQLSFGADESGTSSVSLGEFVLGGIRPAPSGPEQIDIKLAVSIDQILGVALRDHATLGYRSIAFIDISRIELPEFVPEKRIPATNISRMLFDQFVAPALNAEPRTEGLPRNGNDIHAQLTVTFDEALRGAQKNLQGITTETCAECAGSGARPGTATAHCAGCQGTGLKKEVQNTASGEVWKYETCPSCNGDGLIIPSPCSICDGQTWVKTAGSTPVHIPPLIDSGAVYVFPHMGEPGRYGGSSGHLRITVNVAANHPLFTRMGRDISIRLPVPEAFAKAGGRVQVPGIEKGSSFSLTIPPSTRGGEAFQVYESDAHKLTAVIETYRPSMLFVLPGVKRRLQAIAETLDYKEPALPSGPKKMEEPEGKASDGRAQNDRPHVARAQSVPSPSQGRQPTQNNAEFYSRRGALYAQRGQQQRAIADYDKALGLAPNLASAYDDRSAIYLGQGDAKRALADINRALELEPSRAEYYVHRGMCHHYQGSLEQALADYDRALELDPNCLDAYECRGKLHTLRKDPVSALSDYSMALELDPKNAELYHGRAELYTSQKDLTKALADLDKALELDPTNITVLGDRGQIHLLRNDVENALADANQAVKIRPTNAGAYSNRGYLRLLQNHLDEALTDFDKALELDPKLVTAFNNRGQAHMKRGQYKQASEDFGSSLLLNPGETHALLWLGQACQGMGEIRTAIAHYRQVLTTCTTPELRQEARAHLAGLGIDLTP